jgi:hypothetical protein
MANKKISDAEAEVIKDAIIDALENNDEVATEEVVVEEVPTTEVQYPGHHSRDFSDKK